MTKNKWIVEFWEIEGSGRWVLEVDAIGPTSATLTGYENLVDKGRITTRSVLNTCGVKAYPKVVK